MRTYEPPSIYSPIKQEFDKKIDLVFSEYFTGMIEFLLELVCRCIFFWNETQNNFPYSLSIRIAELSFILLASE